jgi:hypothetical protein
MCGNLHSPFGRIRNSIYERTTNGNNPATWTHMGCYVDDLSMNEVKRFGDTNIDFDWTTGSGFGLTFDGQGDYATLPHAPDYMLDGTFSIAFWFTKSACNDPTTPFEVLYSHRALSPGTAGVFIGVGCSHQGVRSTALGDVVRVDLTDDIGQRARVDVPMSRADGDGFLTSEWVHFVLNVGRSGVEVYVDSKRVRGGLGFPTATRWESWVQTECNPTLEVLPICTPKACADPAACTETETAAINAVLGGAPMHTPEACLERGSFDNDCCAGDDQGTCQLGYEKTFGDSCYEPAGLMSSICTPTAAIMTDCSAAGCEADCTSLLGVAAGDSFTPGSPAVFDTNCNLAYPNPGDFAGDKEASFQGFTMESQAYTTGGRQDDRGDYTIPVTLTHGAHHFKAIGNQGGWSSGTFWELEGGGGTPSGATGGMPGTCAAIPEACAVLPGTPDQEAVPSTCTPTDDTADPTCVDDDAAVAAMGTRGLTDCASAVAALQQFGGNCDTDLAAIGKPGVTVAGMCPATCGSCGTDCTSGFTPGDALTCDDSTCTYSPGGVTTCTLASGSCNVDNGGGSCTYIPGGAGPTSAVTLSDCTTGVFTPDDDEDCAGCLSSEDRTQLFTVACPDEETTGTCDNPADAVTKTACNAGTWTTSATCDIKVKIHVEAWGNAVSWEILDSAWTGANWVASFPPASLSFSRDPL